MGQMRRTTAEALTVLDAVMSSIDHDERALLSAPERVVLMGRARKVQDRFTSLACVLTDEASHSSVAATRTPITSPSIHRRSSLTTALRAAVDWVG